MTDSANQNTAAALFAIDIVRKPLESMICFPSGITKAINITKYTYRVTAIAVGS